MRAKQGWLCVMAAALGIPAVAYAGDGVVEINHAVALAGSLLGSPASDPPGYPVVISAPGSYVLTSDLTPPPDTTAVSVTVANVTIDLAGFAIRGANTCSAVGLDVSCAAPDRGRGVDTAGCLPGVRVHDGRVVGMGETGLVLCGSQSRAERVDASANASDGMRLGAGASVSDCIARLNGDDGIQAGDGSVLRDNVVEQNGNHGIRVNGNAVIAGNNAFRNERTGISAILPTGAGASVVRDNSSNANGDDGIAIWSGTVAGNTTEGNADCGIFGLSAARVTATDNVAIDNSPSCSASECCSLLGVTRGGCNLETIGTIIGTFNQRCCPVPGQEDACN